MNTIDKITEKFILVSAEKKQADEQLALESLEELEELVETAGGQVITKILQRVDKINVGLYIGSGKVNEIRILAQSTHATGVVFDDELSPMQMRNLAEALNLKVMDRTMIILDIFASRALSKEGKLQVEMAQLRYQSSRLAGFGTMLSRQAGGIGSRGPGEKKLELDKRHLKTRMEILQSELAEVEKHRSLIRSRREKKNTPIVAIVGYTNAGKSTLLNQLSGSNVYVQNQLFATLDTTTRGIELPSGTEILISDTVGFIRKLPHHLIKAFYSTLEEVKYADIILHVMDISSPYLDTHQNVVHETLKHLDATNIPIITVYNKVDRPHPNFIRDKNATHEVYISAKNNTDCDKLLNMIETFLYDNMKIFEIEVPYTSQEIVRFCHQYAERLEEEYLNEGVKVKGYIPSDKFYKIKPYILS